MSEIIWAEFQNWVRICLWSESGFWSEFVFGPNCRRAEQLHLRLESWVMISNKQQEQQDLVQ